jgi:hypothetical protein
MGWFECMQESDVDKIAKEFAKHGEKIRGY